MTQNGVNVRASAGSTTVNGQQNSGAKGTVIGGPTNAQIGGTGTSYTWWNVNFDSGADGWVASIYLAEVAAPPSVSSVSPGSVTGSSSPITFTVNGSNFVNGAKVQVGYASNGYSFVNTSTNATFVSSTRLTVPITTTTTADTWRVRVLNPDGQTSSGYVTFTVNAPALAPSVSSVSPNSVTGSASPITFTVNGSNFVSGAKVQVGYASNGYTFVNTNTNATFVSSSQLTVPITTTTTADTWRVRVLNPDGQTSSGYVTFTVNAPVNQPGSFTLSNNAPYWDSNSPAGPAVRLNWTPSTGAANYDVYRNGSLYAANLAGTTYLNNLNLTGGQTYSYYVVAKNGAQTRPSNTIQVLMPTSPQTPAPTLTGVTVNGPSSVVPGSSTPYTATAQFSSGPTLDVTASAQWGASGGPSGTRMTGSTLVAGSGAASAATVTATYGDNKGTKTGNKNVSIGTGLSVTATHAPPQALGGDSYRVNLSATATGGTGAITFSWDTNGDGIYGDLTGAAPQWTLNSTGGTYRVGVEATDSQSRTARAIRNVLIDKPAAPQQPTALLPAYQVGGGVLRNSAGDAFQYLTDRRDVGFIAITHGLRQTNEESKEWLKAMTRGIEVELPLQQKAVPNVAFYDWGADTNPADTPVKDIGARLLGYLGRLAPSAILKLASKYGPEAIDFTVDAYYIRPIARSHGQILANYIWLESRANPARINSAKPVHLIGHSAGGFVMGECALVLKQRGFTVDLATMLDTPFPFAEHLRPGISSSSYPNPGTVERYISSAFGTFEFPSSNKIAPDPNYYRFELLDSYIYPTLAAHSAGHQWYLNETIRGRQQSGFYHSPFLHGSSAPHALAQQTKVDLRLASAAPAALVSGFTTFGSVSESNGVYTITEQSDAGVFKDIAVPSGAVKLRFKFKFSGAGDGDFLTVRFGDGPEIYAGLDLEITREDFLEAEVEIGEYAGLTDNLVFTLVSRGGPGAVVQIKDIEIIEDDDADGDGLTTAQELTAGSNPQLADTDGDGWDDAYEVNVSGTSPVFGDKDGDGTSDFAEAMAGTNPNDNASAFVTKQVTRSSDGSITIAWSGKTGKTYRVLRSTTPAFASFDVIATRIVGAEPLTSHTDSGTNLQGVPAAFYRVEVE